MTVPLGPEPVIDPYVLAGGRGVLFADARLTLAGRGVAAVLELPGGLLDGDRLAAVQAWLAAVPHTDRVGRPGSKVDGPRGAALRPVGRRRAWWCPSSLSAGTTRAASG